MIDIHVIYKYFLLIVLDILIFSLNYYKYKN